jgi:integrase
MRIKGVFTLFARKLASGKKVYYYQCYDCKGNRQWAKSTGQSKKTEAIAFCMRLFKDGQLIPEKKSVLFSEFSVGWWGINTCRYLKWRELHEPLTKSTITIHKNNFHRNIKDYFAKYRLNEITPEIIETWLLDLKDKGLMPSTINLQLKTLRMMIGEAFRLKLINSNPSKEVKEVKSEETKRIILSVEEAKKLFPLDWYNVWETKIVYIAHKIGACTGIRISEMLGLKREHIFENYICVKGQYTAFGYVENTKTKHNRNIPITSLMRAELEELLAVNGDGYVFSENSGETPIGREKIHRQFAKALEKIGINRKEQLERKLSYHAWRHFLNTLLRMSNVADSKVQSVTGHRSMRMTEHYTHFDSRQFTEVVDVQTNFLALQKPKMKGKEKLNVQETKKPRTGTKTIPVKQKRNKKLPVIAIKRKPVKKVKA